MVENRQAKFCKKIKRSEDEFSNYVVFFEIYVVILAFNFRERGRCKL